MKNKQAENKTTKPKATAEDYAVKLIEADSDASRAAVAASIPDEFIEAVNQAVDDLYALREAHEAHEAQQAEKRKSLLARWDKQPTTTTPALAERLASIGVAPKQSAFLSALLLHMGITADKLKDMSAATVACRIADLIKSEHVTVPESCSRHKTKWDNSDSSLRQRIANHASEPPAYYRAGRCHQ